MCAHTLLHVYWSLKIIAGPLQGNSGNQSREEKNQYNPEVTLLSSITISYLVFVYVQPLSIFLLLSKYLQSFKTDCNVQTHTRAHTHTAIMPISSTLLVFWHTTICNGDSICISCYVIALCVRISGCYTAFFQLKKLL